MEITKVFKDASNETRKRNDNRGKARCVYASDLDWGNLDKIAKNYGLSRSQTISILISIGLNELIEKDEVV